MMDDAGGWWETIQLKNWPNRLPTHMHSDQFEGILDRHFESRLRAHPIYTTIFVGVKEAEGKLGSMGLGFQQQRQKERLATLKALDGVSPQDLAPEQHIDRLGLRSLLLKETEDFARGRHTMEPSAPGLLMEILLHELMRGDDEPARGASNLRSLLRGAPAFLEEAAEALTHPEPLWLGIMEETIAGAPSLLESIQAFLRKLNGPARDGELAAGVLKALQAYAETARRCEPAPAGSFAVGREVMERRVRDELGLDYTLGQIESLAEAEVARVSGLLQGACRKVGRGSADEIVAQARKEWSPGGPLLEVYKNETERVGAAFKAANAVSFPKGDILQIKPVPEFLRPIIATAAYNPPGAFQKEQRGVFWVKEPEESGDARTAEVQQHFGLPLTCAHEAYPGHHLQFVTANGHPRKWRRLFAHAVFYEGWTLWCEQMCVDLKIVKDPVLKVQQLHDALWRCHRILVDLRMQTGRYSAKQAAQHLQRHLGFTRGRAMAEVNWYSTQPGVPMSYWLGRLEMERLRKKKMDAEGWSLKGFNDWVLSFGTVPQGWIEKYGS